MTTLAAISLVSTSAWCVFEVAATALSLPWSSAASRMVAMAALSIPAMTRVSMAAIAAFGVATTAELGIGTMATPGGGRLLGGVTAAACAAVGRAAGWEWKDGCWVLMVDEGRGDEYGVCVDVNVKVWIAVTLARSG